jgi:hypothetical protein
MTPARKLRSKLLGLPNRCRPIWCRLCSTNQGNTVPSSSSNFLALALLVLFSTGGQAQAQTPASTPASAPVRATKSQYEAGKNSIAADFKAAKTACAALSGNAKDVCMAEARGKRKVALAELELSYRATGKNRYRLGITQAEATYHVARERCDDLSGNAKDVCVKEAQAAEVTAKSDAKVVRKTAEADKSALQKSSDARQDAATDKREAQYRVEKEKCDALSGTAKSQCVDQAKARAATP